MSKGDAVATAKMDDDVSTLDHDARARALEVLKEVIGVLMRGISPVGHPRTRAQIAVREIAKMLHEHAEVFELDADLRAALFEVGSGVEPTLPEYVRAMWDEDKRRNPYIHEPAEEAQ